MRRGCAGDVGPQQRQQLIAVGDARGVRREPRVRGELRAPEGRGHARELAVVPDRDDDVVVRGGEGRPRHDHRVVVAHALRDRAADEVRERLSNNIVD